MDYTPDIGSLWLGATEADTGVYTRVVDVTRTPTYEENGGWGEWVEVVYDPGCCGLARIHDDTSPLWESLYRRKGMAPYAQDGETLYPFGKVGGVWIDPGRCCGRPCIEGTRVWTSLAYHWGGDFQRDYDVTPEQAAAAQRFERVIRGEEQP